MVHAPFTALPESLYSRVPVRSSSILRWVGEVPLSSAVLPERPCPSPREPMQHLLPSAPFADRLTRASPDLQSASTAPPVHAGVFRLLTEVCSDPLSSSSGLPSHPLGTAGKTVFREHAFHTICPTSKPQWLTLRTAWW